MLSLAVALLFAQPSCTPEQASATTIAAIAAAPDRWLDRCVSVSGIGSGFQLYSGLEEMYRASRFAADGNYDPANLRHRIGIDSREIRAHPELAARATRITVTGVVDDCRRRARRIVDAGGVPFLGGYCHYETGPTLVVSHYAISGERFERLVGEDARRRAGNLIEVPGHWQWRAELERVARDFAAAVRDGDRVRLAALLSYGAPLEQEAITRIMTAPAYRELREGRTGEIKLLASTVGGGFEPSSETHTSAHLCYCRTGDCTGRWPIGSVDADAGDERPYICVSVSGRIAPPAALDMYVPRGGGWLAEPGAR